MKVTVTEKHLNTARKNQYFYCLLEVAAMEATGVQSISMGFATLSLNPDNDNKRQFNGSKKAQKLVKLFDDSIGEDKKITKPALATLRKMLPTTVVFKEISQ